MFRIDQAVQNWKLQLSQRQTMTPADIEELETHLQDEMDNLQTAGLTQEESFLVASRRIGDSDQVAGEFAKINTAVIWRNRFFWMIAGMLSAGILSSIAGSATRLSVIFLKLQYLSLSWFWTGIIAPLVSTMVLLGLGWGLYRLIPRSSLWRTTARTKVLLAIGLGLSAVMATGISMLPTIMIAKISRPEDLGQFSVGNAYAGAFISLVWPFLMAALLIFLMPRKTHAA